MVRSKMRKLRLELDTMLSANEGVGNDYNGTPECSLTMEDGTVLTIHPYHEDWDPVEVDDLDCYERFREGASIVDFDAVFVTGDVTARAVQGDANPSTVLKNLCNYRRIKEEYRRSQQENTPEDRMRHMIERLMRESDMPGRNLCMLTLEDGSTVMLEAFHGDESDGMVPWGALPSLRDGSSLLEYNHIEVTLIAGDADATAIEGDGKPDGVISRLAQLM